MAEQKNVQEQDINQLRKVRREKFADLQANGKDPFQITKYDADAHSQEIKDNFETMEGKKVSIAGRIMSKRVMGKASFCNVQDLQGNIQSYVARDNIGEESYKDFKNAYDDAINLLNNESSLQEQIDKSLNELQNAYQRLVKKIGHKVDKSQLESIILKAEKITEETLKKLDTKIVQEFKSALQKAKQIYNNGEVTQLEVNNAITLLSEAIDYLKISSIDKTALQELMKQVEALNAKDYTLSSWKNLKKALINAQSVFKDEKATAEQIMSAEEQLKTAFEHLKKEGMEQTSTTPQKGSSANTSDSTYFVGMLSLVTSILIIVVCLRHKKEQSH